MPEPGGRAVPQYGVGWPGLSPGLIIGARTPTCENREASSVEGLAFRIGKSIRILEELAKAHDGSEDRNHGGQGSPLLQRARF